jgi:hypothetical protein
MFAEASRREFVAVAENSMAAWDEADESITRLAAGILVTDGPRLSFVYLGAVDAAGHLAGAGGVYRDAALAADRRVGTLLAAVRGRPLYPREGWTVVVVTDHGHLDRGGHGGREPEVATAWVAAAGPGIVPGGPSLVTRQDQVAPLVLAALGCLLRVADGRAGRGVGVGDARVGWRAGRMPRGPDAGRAGWRAAGAWRLVAALAARSCPSYTSMPQL